MTAVPVEKSKIAYAVGEKGDRPWGTWEVVHVGEDHIIKRIRVKPGQSLSMQMHEHREEYWKGVRGRGFAEVVGEIFEVTPGAEVYIPRGAVHCLYTTENAVEIEEIQKGKILDENDIKRLSDRYGRV